MPSASNFIGRINELETLRRFLNNSASSLALVYGRRRVGKTRLIEESLRGRPMIFFEGLEGQPQPTQINNFLFQLEQQTGQRIAGRSEIKTWSEALIQLKPLLEERPGMTIVLDELQWMANFRSSLISELKMIWERFLGKLPGAKLILSGSNASFMVKKLLRSQALYGRVDSILHLKPLSFAEVHQFLNKRSLLETELAYLMLGGIPKYLEVILKYDSVLSGIAHESFSDSGYLGTEFQRIFVSHFGRRAVYEKILRALSGKNFGLSRSELIDLKLSSGGGQLSTELYDLEMAGFIQSFVPFDKEDTSKLKRYRLTDPFLYFYITFIDHLRKRPGYKGEDFISTTFVEPRLKSWLGSSFELLLTTHCQRIARILGFSDVSYRVGPYFRHHQGGNLSGAQLDLVYKRADQIFTVVEAKYQSVPIPLAVGRELNAKIAQIKPFSGRTVQRVIFSNQPLSKELAASGLVGRAVSTADLLDQS